MDISPVEYEAQAFQTDKVQILLDIQLHAESIRMIGVVVCVLQSGTRFHIGLLDRIIEPFVETADRHRLTRSRVKFITQIHIIRISVLQVYVTRDIRI